MDEKDGKKTEPAWLEVGPAHGIGSASLKLSAPTQLKLGPSHGQADAKLGVTAGTIIAASSAVVGPSEPQPQSIPEGLGVLSWVGGCAFGGYEVGASVGGIPGAFAGAAVGFVGACAVVRVEPVRERAFKFVRWLSDDRKPDQEP
jgi:hypothetical protein